MLHEPISAVDPSRLAALTGESVSCSEIRQLLQLSASAPPNEDDDALCISLCRESVLVTEERSPCDCDGPLRIRHRSSQPLARRFVCCSINAREMSGGRRVFRSTWSNVFQSVLPLTEAVSEEVCLADQKACGALLLLAGDQHTVHAETIRAAEVELNRALEGYVDAYYGCCTSNACGSAFVEAASPSRLSVHVVILSSEEVGGGDVVPQATSSLFGEFSAGDGEKNTKTCHSGHRSRWCSRHLFTLDLRERCHVVHKAQLSVVNGPLYARFDESRSEMVPLVVVATAPSHGGSLGSVSVDLFSPRLVTEYIGQAVQFMENEVLLPRLTEISVAGLCRLGPRAAPQALPVTGSLAK